MIAGPPVALRPEIDPDRLLAHLDRQLADITGARALRARTVACLTQARADAMAAIEAGADDVESDEEGHWIYTSDTTLFEVNAALEAALGESEHAKLVWKPQAPTEITDLETAQKLMKLIDTLEDDDDVQTVTGNFDIAEEIAAQL